MRRPGDSRHSFLHNAPDDVGRLKTRIQSNLSGLYHVEVHPCDFGVQWQDAASPGPVKAERWNSLRLPHAEPHAELLSAELAVGIDTTPRAESSRRLTVESLVAWHGWPQACDQLVGTIQFQAADTRTTRRRVHG